MSGIENCYNGNPRVKKDGVSWNYTQKELEEYIKCKNDPIYFICNYTEVVHLDHGQVKFQLRDYQKRMINHINENRFSVILSGRQQGKCVHSDTNIKIRNKRTGEVEEVSIGDFYSRLKTQDNG